MKTFINYLIKFLKGNKNAFAIGEYVLATLVFGVALGYTVMQLNPDMYRSYFKSGFTQSSTLSNGELTVKSYNDNYFTQGTTLPIAVDPGDLGAPTGATPTLPPPTGLTVTNIVANTSNQVLVSLQWNDNATTENHYYMAYSIDGNNWNVITPPLAANTTNYVFNAGVLSIYKKYYFKVGAAQGAARAWSSVLTVELGPQAPAKPLDFRIIDIQTNTNGHAIGSFSWNDNANNETGYFLQHSLNNITWTSVLALGANTENAIYDIGVIMNSQTHYFRACASNAYGTICSDPDSDIINPVMPDAPTDLVIVSVFNVANDHTLVHFTWTDNANNEKNYRIAYSVNGGTTYTGQITLPANTQEYTYDLGVLVSTENYLFRVGAWNDIGTAWGVPASRDIGPAPACVATLSPSGLSVQSFNVNGSNVGTINLIWTDNATDETGYYIQHSLDGVNWELPVSLPVNSTAYSYNAGTVTVAQTHYFRVGSFNACNTAWSNIANQLLIPNADTGGSTYCWGHNYNGELGDGTTTQRLLPTFVSGYTFSQISSGNDHTCGITTTGQAYCWGHNYKGSTYGSDQAGALGDNSILSSSSPVTVSGGLTFSKISAGTAHTCGITTTGQAYCWGYGGYGELGYNSLTSTIAPVPVSGGLTFSQIATGETHTCGITTTGQGYCWGNNENGTLGDGTTTNRLVPTPIAGLTFSQISTMYRHTCGITTTGQAYCWGVNTGTLGDGTTTNRLIPTPIAGLTFSQISAGFYHTCGINTTGQAYCWGVNDYGALGDGTTTNRLVPTPIAGLTFSQISAGLFDHTCGINTTGEVYCWGRNYTGEIGDGTTIQKNIPTLINTAKPFSQISSGGGHTCGITAGTVCMQPAAPSGLNAVSDTTNAYAQSLVNLTWTDNATNESGFYIERATSAGGPWVGRVSVGANATSYQYNLGVLAAAGTHYFRVISFNACGESDASNANRSVSPPALFPPVAPSGVALTNVTVDGSNNATVDLVWTDNSNNETGFKVQYSLDDSTWLDFLPWTGANINIYSGNLGVIIPGTVYYFRTVAYNGAGQAWSASTRATIGTPPPPTTGRAYCWGHNDFGKLGNGDAIHQSLPTAVFTPPNLLSQISAGFSHTCALTPAGEAYCWGKNDFGQLGDGSDIDSLVPIAVNTSPNLLSQISAGLEHTCGLTTAGKAYCWGYNAYGEIGDGTSSNFRFLPTAVDTVLTFSKISAGASHNCGITTTGKAYCWGWNLAGQIGDGSIGTDKLLPTAVDTVLTFSQISSGYNHTCGLTTTGEAYCWGNNDLGKLGNGTSTASWIPTPVSGGLTFSQVSAGLEHTCGLTTAGKAYCWGHNGEGQLGDGSDIGRLAPTAVDTVLTFSKLYTGVSWANTCGLTTTGEAYCWGYNGYGQLGNGTSTASWIPTPVSGGYTFSQITVHHSNVCGIVPSIPLPAAPTGIAIASSSLSAKSERLVNLTWVDASSNEDGFYIEHSTNGGSTWSGRRILGPNANSYQYNLGVLSSTQNHSFRVIAYNSGGETLGITPALVTASYGATLPLAPTGLAVLNTSVSGTNNVTVNLIWTDNATNETSYRVQYRILPAGAWTTISGLPINSIAYALNIGVVTVPLTYEFRVSARNAAGDAWSTAINQLIQVPPLKPSGVTIQSITTNLNNETLVNLFWTDNSSNEDGFYIEHSTDNGATWPDRRAVGQNATTFQFNLGVLTTPQIHYFRVGAYKGTLINWSDSPYENANIVPVPPPPPLPPSGFAVTSVAGSIINLIWTDNSNNETGFTIQHSLVSDFSVADAPVNVAQNAIAYAYNVGVATPGVRHYFRVRAFNTGGTSPFINVSYRYGDTLPPAPTTAPAQPTGLSLTLLGENTSRHTLVRLNWNDIATNEDSYYIEHSSNGGTTWTRVTKTANLETFTYDLGVIKTPLTHLFRVGAHNVIGTTYSANQSTGIINPVLPLAPSGLAVTNITVNASNNATANLIWTDNALNETVYRVQYSLDNSTWSSDDIGENSVAYSDNLGVIIPGTVYYFRVGAYNSAGWAWSASVRATIGAPPPVSDNWVKKYGILNKIADTVLSSDGQKLYAVGYTSDDLFVVMRINTADSTVDWKKSYTQFATDDWFQLAKIKLSPAGDKLYVMGTYTPAGITKSVLMRINSSDGTFGAGDWARYYGATMSVGVYSLAISPDGNRLFISGFQQDEPYLGSGHIMLLGINSSNGTVFMKKRFNHNVSLPSFHYNLAASNTNVFVAGFMYWAFSPSYVSQPFILSFTNAGTLAWHKTFGTAELNETIRDIKVSSDGSKLYLYGYYYLSNNDNSYLMKLTASNGTIGAGDYKKYFKLLGYDNYLTLSPDNSKIYILESSVVNNIYKNGITEFNSSTGARGDSMLYIRNFSKDFTSIASTNSKVFTAGNDIIMKTDEPLCSNYSVNPTFGDLDSTFNPTNSSDILVGDLTLSSFDGTNLGGIVVSNVGASIAPENVMLGEWTLGLAADGIPDTTCSALPPVTAPAAPTGITIASSSLNALGQRVVNLTWADTSNNEDGFYIEHSTNGGSTWSGRRILGPNANFYQYNLGVPSSTQNHSFRVIAYNSGGETLGITPALVTASYGATLPLAPTGLNVLNYAVDASKNTVVDLFWNDNATNETAYYIQHSVNGTTWDVAVALPANSIGYSYNLGQIPISQIRYFRVAAYNGAGYAWSDMNTTINPLAVVPPPQPTGMGIGTKITNNKGETLVNLFWSDNAPNEDNYYVYHSLDGSTWSGRRSVSVNSTTYQYNLGVLSSADPHYFIVCAYNASGQTCSSSANQTIGPIAPCIIYQNLTTYNGSNQALATITWQNPSNQISYSSNGGASWVNKPLAPGSLTDTYNLGVLTDTSQHCFRVVPSCGTTDIACKWEMPSPPLQPGALAAAPANIDGGRNAWVNLTWTDASVSESEYLVQHALAAGGPWDTAIHISANSSAYNYNLGVTAVAQTHYFRVAASNVNSTVWSAVASRAVPATASICNLFVGMLCADGSIFAGNTSGSIPIYAYPSDESSLYSWNNGLGLTPTVTTGANSLNNGVTNHNILVAAADLQTPYKAEMVCADKVALGRSDWYLPSIEELGLLYTNRNEVGILNLVDYWSSTESSSTQARYIDFLTGTGNPPAVASQNKNITMKVRCVRR